MYLLCTKSYLFAFNILYIIMHIPIGIGNTFFIKHLIKHLYAHHDENNCNFSKSCSDK